MNAPSTPNTLLQQHDNLILMFTTTWCGPCKILKQNLAPLLQDMPTNVHFTEVDCEAEEDFAAQYDITSIPTIIFFKKGQLIQRIAGAKPISTYREIIETAFLA